MRSIRLGCRARAQPDTREDDDPDVLELRIHGVANTPPAQMLDLLPGEVVQVDGDELGSFWAPTPAAAAAPRAASDPRAVPDGVRREAYSWGAMARFSTIPGLGRVSGTVAGLVRALWVLIVPFGLVNVAYWSRDADEPAGRRSSAAGGLVRLFGLTLTLLWVASAASVLLGVVAAQCYGPRTSVTGPASGTTVQYVLTCTALPGWADAAARWSVGGRTAALGLVAALAVLALAAVGSTGRLRYERRMSSAKSSGLADAPMLGAQDVWPALARPGFWTHARRSSAQGMGHLAAAFALLAGLLAWHLLYRDVPQCARASGFADRGCLAPDVWAAPGKGGWAVLVAAAGLVLLVAGWRTVRLRIDPLPHGATRTAVSDLRVTRAPDAVLLVAALVVLACTLGAVARSGDAPLGTSGDEPFLGLVALPRLLVAVMVLLVIAAVGVRARLRAALWAPLLVLVLLASLVSVVWAGATVVARVVALTGLLVLVVAALTANLRHPGRRREGWAGAGPAVLLCLAGGTAMVLSAAAVLGAVAVLEAPGAAENVRTPADVTALLDEASAGDPLRDAVTVHVPAAAELATPAGYVQFAVASVLVLVLLLIAVVVLVARMGLGRRRPIPVVPAGTATTPHDAQQAAVQRGRRHAALAHRAEPVVGLLAALFLGALVAALVLPDPRETFDGFVGDVWAFGVRWADRAVVTAFGLVVASVVLAGSKKSLARPWGLLWDLMCFLPRAAHPFAPPCYAERVVPELRARIDAWLGDDGTPLPGGAASRARRRVVLSAHSLGGVVAVAALLARWDGSSGPHDHRVALLTYGTQLRAYFGRFFPELLGPAALGTRPSAGARTWSSDPWTAPTPDAPPRVGTTLVDSLTGPSAPGRARARDVTRWRSLWRRTDFIGFPVDGYRDSAIDAPADEIDPDAYLLTVASHSGYPRTPQYRLALDELVATARASRPA